MKADNPIQTPSYTVALVNFLKPQISQMSTDAENQ